MSQAGMSRSSQTTGSEISRLTVGAGVGPSALLFQILDSQRHVVVHQHSPIMIKGQVGTTL